MTAETSKPAPPESHPGWTILPPKKPPEPGVWPVTLALAITLLVWGLVTSPIITGVGLALFAVAMAGWIRDIRHERAKH
jgi:hypothetical protein